MPVYERGYKHWESSGRKADPPWWVIARRGITAPLRKRAFLLLLMLCWVPAIVKGVIIYINVLQRNLLSILGQDWTSIDPAGVYSFLGWQKYFVLIVLTIVGTRLVARDRNENGLALYFSRPLNLRDYLAGKSLIIMFYYFMVTLFPVYALSLFAYLVAAGQIGLVDTVSTVARATVFCSLTGLSLSLILLALSSLGRREVFITVGWVLLYLGSHGVANLFVGLGQKNMGLLDFPSQYFQAGAFLLQARPNPDFSPWASFIMVALYTVMSVLILRARIKPVEVVA